MTPGATSRTTVTTADTSSEPRHPRRLLKNKNTLAPLEVCCAWRRSAVAGGLGVGVGVLAFDQAGQAEQPEQAPQAGLVRRRVAAVGGGGGLTDLAVWLRARWTAKAPVVVPPVSAAVKARTVIA